MLGLDEHPLVLVAGNRGEDVVGLLARQGDHDEVAQPLQQVLDESARIMPGLDDPFDHGEQARPVAGGDGLHRVVEEGGVGEAQEGDRLVVGEHPLFGSADQLVENGEGIAHGAAAGPYDERQDSRADLDALVSADAGHERFEGLGRDEPEGVVVGARADRADDLLGLRRGEDEFDVVGGFLDELEEGVEPLVGDHVGFVDDEDLVAVPCGGEGGAFDELAGVVHSAVARGVHLDHVEAPSPGQGELAAGFAFAARGVRGGLRAVQAAREDPRRRGLPAAARAGEEVGVCRSASPQGRHDGPRDVFLADHVLESLRAVSPVQCHAHATSLRAGAGVLTGFDAVPRTAPPHRSTSRSSFDCNDDDADIGSMCQHDAAIRFYEKESGNVPRFL